MAGRQAALGFLGAALLAAAPAPALEVTTLNVSYHEGRYIVEFLAQLDAPAEAVGTVLMDYAHYPDLDDRIIESKRVTPEQGGGPLLYTRLRGCVGALLCRTMQRVEQLEEHPGELVATALPAQSDVRFGLTRSRWQTHAGGTAVNYRLEITPDFWIPPFIGRRLMIRALREGTLSMFTNVERAARRHTE